MLFNSLSFALFLPIVFIIYWFVVRKSNKAQNVILLLASYYFYACWDWRFLFLLFFSTFLDYFTGIKIFEAQTALSRKIWLYISLIINLGFLCYFKYYNFFISSLTEMIEITGYKPHFNILSIILPVGISFYTFHGLSYVYDIYYKRIQPTRDLVQYSLFVNFFPLLLAGPIERATHLLPQIKNNRKFNYPKVVDGLRQILWGFVKKLVIADNCAPLVDKIFFDYHHQSGSTLLLGGILFTFQIFADFSGYSDIALGTARLFGFELSKNFNFPFFSRDFVEFWSRWHISLSTWFKNYVYKPLGGSKGNDLIKLRNILIIFLLSGLWHGANWTFIFLGFVNATLVIGSVLLRSSKNRTKIVAHYKYFPSIKEIFQMGSTFFLFVLTCIIFRSVSIKDAFSYLSKMFSETLFTIPAILPTTLLISILIFLLLEWKHRMNNHTLEKIGHKWSPALRFSLYIAIVCYIGLFMASGENEFIYFQF